MMLRDRGREEFETGGDFNRRNQVGTQEGSHPRSSLREYGEVCVVILGHSSVPPTMENFKDYRDLEDERPRLKIQRWHFGP